MRLSLRALSHQSTGRPLTHANDRPFVGRITDVCSSNLHNHLQRLTLATVNTTRSSSPCRFATPLTLPRSSRLTGCRHNPAGELFYLKISIRSVPCIFHAFLSTADESVSFSINTLNIRRAVNT